MQLLTLNSGGYSTADADSICLEQSVLAGSEFLIDGVLASGGNANLSPAGYVTITPVSPAVADADSVCLAQTVSSGDPFDINGALSSGGVATLSPPGCITITPSGDDTGTNFTVTGTDLNDDALIEVIAGAAVAVTSVHSFKTITDITPDANTDGNVSVGTAAADGTGNNFTVTGVDANGVSCSEIIAGDTGAVTSTISFATITSVVPELDTCGSFRVGTSQSGYSRALRLDTWAFPQCGFQVSVSGTVNYTVQQTFQGYTDPANPVAPADMQWLDSTDSNVVSATETKISNFAYSPVFVRIKINSGDGTATMNLVQYGNVSA